MVEKANQMPLWQKQAIMVIGVALVFVGIPAGVSSLCLGISALIDDYGMPGIGVISLLVGLLTFGGGLATFTHAVASINKKPSGRLRLPVPWVLVGGFVFLIAFGLLVLPGGGAGFLFAPILIITALLPPTWAVSWFRGIKPDGLTWRRGVVAFFGGAMFSVLLAIISGDFIPRDYSFPGL